jgi:hypothetical protein
MIDRERGESESDKRRFDVKRYIPSALRAQDKTVRIKYNLLLLFFRIMKIYIYLLATTWCLIRSSILFNEKNSNDNHVFIGKRKKNIINLILFGFSV